MIYESAEIHVHLPIKAEKWVKWKWIQRWDNLWEQLLLNDVGGETEWVMPSNSSTSILKVSLSK